LPVDVRQHRVLVDSNGEIATGLIKLYGGEASHHTIQIRGAERACRARENIPDQWKSREVLADKTILAAADAMIGKAREAMKTQQLHQVLNAVWAVVADANRYFAGEAPWALAKTDPARQGTVLYVTAEVIRQVAILTQPFIPTSSSKLLDLLGIPGEERDFAALGAQGRIAPGTALGTIAPVFPRYIEPEAKAG